MSSSGLLEETLKMHYPRELLQIQVLDDSTDETHPFTEALVRTVSGDGASRSSTSTARIAMATRRARCRKGLQDGHWRVRRGFRRRLHPARRFPRRTMDYFTDPKVGVVQTRWTYLNRHYNLLTEVEAMLLDGHFVLEHGARFGGGLFFNFNGTAGILRREHDRGRGRLAA